MLLPTITLQPGDSGNNVRELQLRLVAAGQMDEGSVNGTYDGTTTNAVRDFQGLHGLKPDGIAGPSTIRKLNAVVAGAAGNEGDAEKREEEELDKTAAHAAAVELAEAQEETLDPEALGIAEESVVAEAPAAPPAPTMDDVIDQPDPSQRPETTDALFLDDPSFETNMLDSAPPAPEPEPEQNVPPAVAEAPPPPAVEPVQAESTVRFEDPRLDAIDRALPEPVKTEVRQAGDVMAKQGVQQTAVPADMDISAPSQTPQVQQQQGAGVSA